MALRNAHTRTFIDILLRFCSALQACYPASKGNTSAGYAFVMMTWIYNFAFSYGIGPLSWAYPVEIMNTATRAKGTALTSMSCWIANFFIVSRGRLEHLADSQANFACTGSNHSSSYQSHRLEILHLFCRNEFHKRRYNLSVLPVSQSWLYCTQTKCETDMSSFIVVKPKEFRSVAFERLHREIDS